MDCIVAGGTGLVGRNLIAELSAEPAVTSITALARTALFKKADKVKVLKTSFEEIELLELPQAQAGFCCLGTTIKKAGSREVFYRVDHDYVIAFAKACQAAGVKSFFYVSAHGADPSSRIFYNQVKGRTERDLGRLGFEKLVIIRPSLLLGDRNESRPAEKAAQIVSRYIQPLMKGPLEKIRPVEAVKVAQKLRAAAVEASLKGPLVVIANHQI
jgi:uncharacterized protein YbjT (DUF2867 family)